MYLDEYIPQYASYPRVTLLKGLWTRLRLLGFPSILATWERRLKVWMIFTKGRHACHGLGCGKFISPKYWMQMFYHLIIDNQVGRGLVSGHRVWMTSTKVIYDFRGLGCGRLISPIINVYHSSSSMDRVIIVQLRSCHGA